MEPEANEKTSCLAPSLAAALLFWQVLFYFWQQIKFPPLFDEAHYMGLAESFNKIGIVGTPEALRTWLYPWILSIIAKVSNLINLPFSCLLMAAQFCVHWLAIKKL
jgi:hypothetical protein